MFQHHVTLSQRDNHGFCSFNMRTKGFFDKPNMNLNAIVLPDIPIWLIDKS